MKVYRYARWALFCASAVLSSAVVAHTFPIEPMSDVVGSVKSQKTRYQDTFADIGAAEGVGYLALVHANPGVDPWLPGDGTTIRIPTRYILPPGPRRGIVINLAEYRLYYYHRNDGKSSVEVFPIGIGADGKATPIARTEVKSRIKAPTWYPPKDIRQEHAAEGEPIPAAIPAGPDNPLGPYALQLGVAGYFIHGTNKQFGIGTRVSHGCIRMYNPDITALVRQVEPGTPVRIIDQPVKFGMQGATLWVEVHHQGEKLKAATEVQLQKDAVNQLQNWKLQYPMMAIDHAALRKALKGADGIPQQVGQLQQQAMGENKADCSPPSPAKKSGASQHPGSPCS
ncbi:L,D-transpeptidase family protein [Mangrovitalea sediminis]|uniref:L,D-transpeptidase family protein n=1 Tax=Mangrovitalea sediminis TaxID=1982043 RepID=UPI000BE60FAD|nr:L,D-transpeptidase family protein [Mangrovitalea sediminis]